MIKFLFNGVSYVLHPLFIPIYGTLYYLTNKASYLSFGEKGILTTQVVIITILIPLGLYYVLKSINKVQSLMMATAKERKIPLAINCILLLLFIKNNIYYNYNPELYLFFTAGLLSCIVSLLLSILNFKVSLHMIGISGLAIFVLLLKEWSLSNILIQTVMIISIGLVASSRLQMKAHNTIELLAGFFVGLIPMLFLMLFWL